MIVVCTECGKRVQRRPAHRAGLRDHKCRHGAPCKGAIDTRSACGHCRREEHERKNENPPLLRFTLAGLPPINSARRSHWRVQQGARKQWRGDACSLARAHILPGRNWPLAKARVRFTRCSSVRPDYGNLVESFKPILDGLVDANVLIDDAPEFVRDEYRHTPAPAKSGCVIVEVWNDE